MKRLVPILLLLIPMSIAAEPTERSWRELAPLPDPIGVAGPFVGVAGERLVVAGGANFAEGRRPWQGGVKTWRDTIWTLRSIQGDWARETFRLPRPLGYGAAVSTPEGLWCIGGADRERHFADVFLISSEDGELRISPQSALPVPLAYSAAAAVGSQLVVAGGTESPLATEGTSHVFALSLAAPISGRAWRRLPPLPGPPRMLATAGAAGDHFYVFGGVQLRSDGSGQPERIRPYLADAWRIDLEAAPPKWERLPDLPAPRAACPTPAPLVDGRLLVVSGDDSSLTPAEEDRHTGFPATVLAFDVGTGKWTHAGELPRVSGSDPASHPEECLWPPVTTGTAMWQNHLVIPSGEIRPGVRTRRVLAMPLR
jgi:N-acetylneuraminic acid mutarotase